MIRNKQQRRTNTKQRTNDRTREYFGQLTPFLLFTFLLKKIRNMRIRKDIDKDIMKTKKEGQKTGKFVALCSISSSLLIVSKTKALQRPDSTSRTDRPLKDAVQRRVSILQARHTLSYSERVVLRSKPFACARN